MRKQKTTGKQTPHPKTTPSHKPAPSSSSQLLVRPFETFDTTDTRLTDIRQIVRQQLERLERDKEISEGSRDLREEFDSLRERLLKGECREGRLDRIMGDLHKDLKDLKDLMYKELIRVEEKLEDRVGRVKGTLEEMEGRWLVEARLSRKSLVENSKVQLLEATLEEMIERVNRLSLGKTSEIKKAVEKEQNNSNLANFSIPATAEVQIRAFKAQCHLQIAQVKDAICQVQHQLFELTRDLKKKASTVDISEAISDMKEKIKDNTLNIEQIHSQLYENQCEHSTLNTKLQKLEQQTQKQKSQLQQQLQSSCNSLGNSIHDLSDTINHKIAQVVGSYNLNFEQIDINTYELGQMLSELLNINSKLTQKLLTMVTHKLDSNHLESTIQDLSERVSSQLWTNRRKITQIDEKEFQVQSQLRHLKEMLDSLKNDYEKNYHKLRFEEQKSEIWGSGRKTLWRERGKENRDINRDQNLSPKIDGQIRKDFSAGAYVMSGFSSRQRRSTICKIERPSCFVRVKLSDELGM